jgi:hypothetical protein
LRHIARGSKEQRLCRTLRDAAIGNFEAHHWIDLGIELGAPEIVQDHNRLLRSLSFGDDDYPVAAYEVIIALAEWFDFGETGPDVQKNLSLMVNYFREREIDVGPVEIGDPVSNSAAVGDPKAYSVTREIRMGNRAVNLKFRKETEAAFYDALVAKRYVVLPMCSMVYFNSEYGGTRVREPDFLIFFRGFCWQIEIDGAAHNSTPAYQEQEKYDPLHDEGVVLRRVSAVGVSNGTGKADADRRKTWAKEEVAKLEEWMINQIRVRSRIA